VFRNPRHPTDIGEVTAEKELLMGVPEHPVSKYCGLRLLPISEDVVSLERICEV
jgi:hypothetical protein